MFKREDFTGVSKLLSEKRELVQNFIVPQLNQHFIKIYEYESWEFLCCNFLLHEGLVDIQMSPSSPHADTRARILIFKSLHPSLLPKVSHISSFNTLWDSLERVVESHEFPVEPPLWVPAKLTHSLTHNTIISTHRYLKTTHFITVTMLYTKLEFCAAIVSKCEAATSISPPTSLLLCSPTHIKERPYVFLKGENVRQAVVLFILALQIQHLCWVYQQGWRERLFVQSVFLISSLLLFWASKFKIKFNYIFYSYSKLQLNYFLTQQLNYSNLLLIIKSPLLLEGEYWNLNQNLSVSHISN
jgi:hypothetical protein